jgi:hypothetical protein
LAVVVNEFEVVPEPREARAAQPAGTPAASPRPVDVRRQVEGALRTLLARHLRLRAS